jgi:myo-inositol-1(or 4)-monophosphatase
VHPDTETTLTLDALLAAKDVVVPLARDLGRFAAQESAAFRRGEGDLGVHAKTSPGDVVTIVDEEVQRRLAAALRSAFPGYGFVGEEGLDEGDHGAPTWVVDPIDGTHNFVRDYPGFCVSVGLVERGVSVLGVIYDSVDGEVSWAVRGGGAWREGRRLQTRPVAALSHALVTTNVTAESAADPLHREVFWEIAGHAAGIRASGSACRDFCLVASGRLDLFWQLGLRAWDVAAGIVLVQEAGGVVAFAGAPRDWVRAGPLALFAGAPALVADAKARACAIDPRLAP